MGDPGSFSISTALGRAVTETNCALVSRPVRDETLATMASRTLAYHSASTVMIVVLFCREG
jgi:hypothetical protein